MLKQLSNILDIRYVFCTTISHWIVFGLRTLDKILNLYLLPLYFTSVITVSASFGSFPINLLYKLIDWFLCNLDALIGVYGSYLICSIYFIYLFICFMLYLFCLLILILLFVEISSQNLASF